MPAQLGLLRRPVTLAAVHREGSPCVGSDDPVGGDAGPPLEGDHCRPRATAELAVRHQRRPRNARAVEGGLEIDNLRSDRPDPQQRWAGLALHDRGRRDGALQAQGRAFGPGRCARATREQLGDGAVPRARLEIEDVTRRWIEPGPTPLLADASPGPRSDIRLLIEGVARLPHVRTLASRPAADSGGWVV